MRYALSAPHTHTHFWFIHCDVQCSGAAFFFSFFTTGCVDGFRAFAADCTAAATAAATETHHQLVCYAYVNERLSVRAQMLLVECVWQCRVRVYAFLYVAHTRRRSKPLV